MTIKLQEDERLDELQRNGYQIIQNPKKFCFGMDAVLLSGFTRIRPGETALDLGTGTGIIPILLRGKTEGRHFTGLEIQEESADMARRSVAFNHLEQDISIITGDIKEAAEIFGAASFDVVTSNPPYMTGNHGLVNPRLPKAIARHELLCSPEAGFIWYTGLSGWQRFLPFWFNISWSPRGCAWCILLWIRSPTWF